MKKCVLNKNDDRYERAGEIIEKRYEKSYIKRFIDGKVVTRNFKWLGLLDMGDVR